MQSLQDPAYRVVQELEDILNALNLAHEEAFAFLSNLDHQECQKNCETPLTLL